VPPPTTTPSLTLRADATSVQAGAPSIGLHATLTGAQEAVTWTLAGPGRLSAASGADVTYVPPDADSLDSDGTATVTIAAGPVPPKSVAIAVSAVDRPGHHWTLVQRSVPVITSVAQGGGAFVATTIRGVARSTDGLSWTDIPLNISASALAWGDAGWVVIGGEGDVRASADGVAWTPVPQAIAIRPMGIVFGNHTYLAFSYHGVATSTDGVRWNTVSDQGLSQVAFGNGLFMGLCQTAQVLFHDVHPCTSVDGAHWRVVTDIPYLDGLAFANGQFVANRGSVTYVTDDGSAWIGNAADPVALGGMLQAAGTALFELGPDMSVQFPGSAWQRVPPAGFLSRPRTVAANADRFVGVSWNGWITTSSDGTHWSTQVEGSYGDLQAATFVGGQFVAISTLGQVLRSADGLTWTKAAMLDANAPLLYPVAIAQAGTTLVAVGSGASPGIELNAGGANGLRLRSADGGATWAQASTSGPAESLSGVAYDGRRFVSVALSGALYASPDGDAWVRIGAAPAGKQYRGIAFGGGTYLAYGWNAVATSTDGVTWTAIDPAVALAGPASMVPQINTLTWDGTRFVTVGSWNDPTTDSGPSGFAAVSTDGQQWTTKANPPLAAAAAITRCGNELVAVGQALLASSTDGLTWNPHAQVDGATELKAVACGNDRFVGVGAADAIVTSIR
jgi:hypothetical protein